MLNKDGYEVPDNTPVEIPTRLKLPASRVEQIRNFIRFELAMKAASEGHETFEEADDIEPEDEDSLPFTPYEMADLEPIAPPDIPPEDNPNSPGTSDGNGASAPVKADDGQAAPAQP